MFAVATDVSDVFRKLYEASWRHREVVFRIGFKIAIRRLIFKRWDLLAYPGDFLALQVRSTLEMKKS